MHYEQYLWGLIITIFVSSFTVSTIRTAVAKYIDTLKLHAIMTVRGCGRGAFLYNLCLTRRTGFIQLCDEGWLLKIKSCEEN